MPRDLSSSVKRAGARAAIDAAIRGFSRARLGAALVPVCPWARSAFWHGLDDPSRREQGSFWGLDFQLTNLHERFFTLRGIEFFGRLNFLKAGYFTPDRITTVSEHYRREILTPAGGCGLDGVLRENAHRLSAILDGVDYTRWNPASDRLLPARYDAPTPPWKRSLS